MQDITLKKLGQITLTLGLRCSISDSAACRTQTWIGVHITEYFPEPGPARNTEKSANQSKDRREKGQTHTKAVLVGI